ncbi:hypothetical protein M9Y10_012640 [Tritrichomonas musculus]|uniref:Rab-GAP TBC domain-containing protein n=1 Tax=Tritrichomonas musculus TaxID=1915356 RepID=A0ABR2GIJ4_9EUKA
MNFDLPPEEKIVEGLRLLDCTIFCYNDVAKFLTDNVPEKKVADRFISWLVSLRILHQRRQSWGTTLYQISENYFERCRQCFSKKPQEPLSIVPMAVESVIRKDVENAIPWLEQLFKDCQMSKKILNAPTLRLSRIFALMVHESKEISYTQNFYHIGCVCLVMTSVFSELAKLSADFAEAISFYLVRSIISIIPLVRIKDSNQKLLSHFEELDQVISNVAPEQYKVMNSTNTGSISFGIRYEILLFATENHNIIDILDMWDQIFGRLARLEFIECLTAAHVMQVRIPPDTKNVGDFISNWKNWNVVQLIKDAAVILEHNRSFCQSCCMYFCPRFKSFSGYEVKSQFL